jgi:hypothetical protein
LNQFSSESFASGAFTSNKRLEVATFRSVAPARRRYCTRGNRARRSPRLPKLKCWNASLQVSFNAIAEKTNRPARKRLTLADRAIDVAIFRRYGLSLSLSGFSFGGFLSVFFGGLSAFGFGCPSWFAGGLLSAAGGLFSVAGAAGLAAGGGVAGGRTLVFEFGFSVEFGAGCFGG